jgi:hypothetical protein
MVMEVASAQRAKRFERRITPPAFHLTDRDLTLLSHVARHRFLSSAHLAALDGGSPQNILRALRVLFDHEYLDRPKEQLATMPVDGSRPYVYGLGKRGARELREQGHRINTDVDWTEKNKRAGSKFIEHTLQIADFMVGLELACRGHSGVNLLREHEIIQAAPEITRRAREPLRWRVERIERGRREITTVVPDGLFALTFPDDTAAYFLLEVDRGTIPIYRTDTEGTAAWRKNIRYKLATYYDGWKAGRHFDQFGVKQVRVITITSSAKRVENMLAVIDEITEGRGSNFFLFADRTQLEMNNVLDALWTSGKGEMVRLVD